MSAKILRILQFSKPRRLAKQTRKQLELGRVLRFPDARKATEDYCPKTANHNHVLVERSDCPEVERCQECGLWLVPDELLDLLRMGWDMPKSFQKFLAQSFFESSREIHKPNCG
jgi:hypothetical protein